ncbi:hypothetical protein BDR05DRAFT_127102 [Suillus weaverae]|nr:hypothetical protein BDR05DRAFT_127102 [Suillus weaverae]
MLSTCVLLCFIIAVASRQSPTPLASQFLYLIPSPEGLHTAFHDLYNTYGSTHVCVRPTFPRIMFSTLLSNLEQLVPSPFRPAQERPSHQRHPFSPVHVELALVCPMPFVFASHRGCPKLQVVSSYT